MTTAIVDERISQLLAAEEVRQRGQRADSSRVHQALVADFRNRSADVDSSRTRVAPGIRIVPTQESAQPQR